VRLSKNPKKETPTKIVQMEVAKGKEKGERYTGDRRGERRATRSGTSRRG
jgi:hypothetical protein